MPMPRRRLGNSGATVSALGLGCMAMTETYSASPLPTTSNRSGPSTVRSNSVSTLSIRPTSTAWGRDEELLARALADRRDRAFLATKIGNVKSPDGKYLGVDGSATYVKAACRSLAAAVNAASVDLLPYLHRADAKTPIEELPSGAMGELVAAGKVRYLGLSEVGPETLRRAYAVHPIAALQSEFSLWTRDVETDDVLATARELGVALVAYCPLGRGFSYRTLPSPEDLPANDSRRGMPRFSAGNFAANCAFTDAIAALAERKGCSAPQLALAWLLRHDHVVPIPGTKSVVHLEENAGSAGIRLDDQDLAEIDAVLPPGAAAGDRKAPWGMQLTRALSDLDRTARRLRASVSLSPGWKRGVVKMTAVGKTIHGTLGFWHGLAALQNAADVLATSGIAPKLRPLASKNVALVGELAKPLHPTQRISQRRDRRNYRRGSGGRRIPARCARKRPKRTRFWPLPRTLRRFLSIDDAFDNYELAAKHGSRRRRGRRHAR